jgi:hypothetical protein
MITQRILDAIDKELEEYNPNSRPPYKTENEQWDEKEFSDFLWDFLKDSQIYHKTTSGSRWYDHLFCVGKIGDILVGWNDYYCTGDMSVRDMDLQFDLDSVGEVEAFEKTITDYRYIKQ